MLPPRATLSAVLARFDLQCDGEVERIDPGKPNHGYRVPARSGTFLLRRIRDDQPLGKIIAEHAAIEWAGDNGIPVARPLRATDDADHRSWVIMPDGSRWSAFPFIEGRRPLHPRLCAREAAVMGDMFGRVHAAFARHPGTAQPAPPLKWYRNASIAMLDDIAKIAHAAHEEDEVLAAIATHQRLLLNQEPVRPGDFAQLPRQMLHGDFDASQFLLDRQDCVAAVLDWECFGFGVRVHELVRALTLSGIIESTRLAFFLRAYGRHVQLTPDECDQGMELWWRSWLGDAWAWQAYFLAGSNNARGAFPFYVMTLRKLGQPGWREDIDRRFREAAMSSGNRLRATHSESAWPAKWLDSEWRSAEVMDHSGAWRTVTANCCISVSAGAPVRARLIAVNTGEARWLPGAASDASAGYVRFGCNENFGDAECRKEIAATVDALGMAESGEFVILAGVAVPTRIAIQMVSEGVAWFGETITATLLPHQPESRSLS